jgi:hypothetical protein
LIAIAAALAVLVIATPAQAASVSMAGTTAVFTAAPGELNDVDARLNDDGSVQIADRNNPVRTSGIPGCQGSGQSIDCMLAATALVVELGDGDDKALAEADGSMPLTVSGGDGDDELTGRGDAVTLNGGAGDDFMEGLGRNPLFAGGTGSDLFANHAPATVDCAGGGVDRGFIPAKLTLRGCPAPPACKVKVAKGQTIKSFVTFGLDFAVTCARAAAIRWTATPDKATRRFMHTASKYLAANQPPVDEGGYPLLAPAGKQSIAGRVNGVSTRKALLRARKVVMTLEAGGTDGLALLRPTRVRVTLR